MRRGLRVIKEPSDIFSLCDGHPKPFGVMTFGRYRRDVSYLMHLEMYHILYITSYTSHCITSYTSHQIHHILCITSYTSQRCTTAPVPNCPGVPGPKRSCLSLRRICFEHLLAASLWPSLFGASLFISFISLISFISWISLISW